MTLPTPPPPPPVLQEAVSTRDLELVQLVLRYRDYQRVLEVLAGIPCVLLEKRAARASFFASPPWPSIPVSSAGVATSRLHPPAQDFSRGDEMEFTSCKRDCQGLGLPPAPGLQHCCSPA